MGPWPGVTLATGLGLLISVASAQEVAPASPPPAAASAQKIPFHIDVQPLAEALNELGDRSGLTVIMYSDLGRGLLASPVIGSYAPRDALDRLLAHTGLHYEYLDTKTVLILRSATSK